MKPFFIVLLLLPVFKLPAQHSEFSIAENGLIYPDLTIRKLKFIVDSLNLKFRVCDLSRTYYAMPQAKANYVSMEGLKVREAKKDMDAAISFREFMRKYPKAAADRELLVVKSAYKDYEGKDVLSFQSLGLAESRNHELNFEENLERYDKPLKGKWIYTYYPDTDYTEPSLDAFYFLDEFTSPPLPPIYARMIQYSDCMVDTSTQIFYETARYTSRFSDHESGSGVTAFLDYFNRITHMPEYKGGNSDAEYKSYRDQMEEWESLKWVKADSLKAKDPHFIRLLNESLAEARRSGGSNEAFEGFVGRYMSKEAELDLKRRRRVVGFCSQDQSPRIHALKIAELSAETVNWEIFLRSHLDIMNDNFERSSDGSYAWAGRKTYIRELEVLDIHVLHLLMGISLRMKNPSLNHYYGSISRVGRALSETTRMQEAESLMLQMIADRELDDYNRLLMYYLFLTYNDYLEDNNRKRDNEKKLEASLASFPPYLLRQEK